MDSSAETADNGVPTFLWLKTFPGEAGQVRAVRHWIESLLPDCDPRAAIALVASEYAANAITHTRSGEPGGQFVVHLAWSPAMVRLTVGDQGSPRPPEAVTAALDSEHGRGLFMVNAMTENWGAAETPVGRLLWADIPWAGQGGPARPSANGDTGERSDQRQRPGRDLQDARRAVTPDAWPTRSVPARHSAVTGDAGPGCRRR